MQTALQVVDCHSEITLNPDMGVHEADVHTVRRWLDAGEALLVDVREAVEVENERVPGALMMPLSLLDGEVFPRLPGLRLVFMCAVGKRSAAATKQLVNHGHSLPINMVGGLGAWKEAGYPTEA
ncbi:MAG: rhodanese-like domain-containing protein [Hyphomicrobiales bacterium]|nr:rhodanese-like domain-containing protein [Hyphomicrobiales bacterium]